MLLHNIGAFIIRIGFWGILYFIVIMRNPSKNSIGNYLGPYSTLGLPCSKQRSASIVVLPTNDLSGLLTSPKGFKSLGV